MDLNNSTTPESEQDLAQTPRWFVRAAETHLGFRFDLDVCALKATAKCGKFYSLSEFGEDGLTLPWSGYNWCNMPFSDVLPWVEKAETEAGEGRISCLLMPDKPEVGYVRTCKESADTIMHMPFRLNFLRPDGSRFLDKHGRPQGPKFPVMLSLFTSWGLEMPARDIYVDFRLYAPEKINEKSAN